jgi:cell division protein FtsW (lipid II flippase)
MIKYVTGFPCPSCGTTRAVQLLFKGDFIASVLTNPFGIIVSGSMLFLPFWIVIDLILKKETFYRFYNKMECLLKQKKIAIPLIILVVLNWIWNINKGL